MTAVTENSANATRMSFNTGFCPLKKLTPPTIILSRGYIESAIAQFIAIYSR
jgi:hypothetical protein